jgi:hypothetical protein
LEKTLFNLKKNAVLKTHYLQVILIPFDLIIIILKFGENTI